MNTNEFIRYASLTNSAEIIQSCLRGAPQEVSDSDIAKINTLLSEITKRVSVKLSFYEDETAANYVQKTNMMLRELEEGFRSYLNKNQTITPVFNNALLSFLRLRILMNSKNHRKVIATEGFITASYYVNLPTNIPRILLNEFSETLDSQDDINNLEVLSAMVVLSANIYSCHIQTKYEVKEADRHYDNNNCYFRTIQDYIGEHLVSLNVDYMKRVTNYMLIAEIYLDVVLSNLTAEKDKKYIEGLVLKYGKDLRKKQLHLVYDDDNSEDNSVRYNYFNALRHP